MNNLEMKLPEDPHEMTVRRIAENDLGTVVREAKLLTGGYVGHVYKISFEKGGQTKEAVVKLVDYKEADQNSEESNNTRIYGQEWSNLKPSHDILRAHGFHAPTLYSVGELDSPRMRYSVMEFLEGDYSRDYMVSYDEPSMNELHGLVGATMGKMHTITRSFQGWVDLKEAHAKEWKTAFFESCESHLRRAARFNTGIASTTEKIQEFIDAKKQSWSDPKEFVFSHTDGLQAVVKYENAAWQLKGIIDVEDNQFTDQRFVLAGHELSLEYNKKAVLAEFWEQYRQHTEVDESYKDCKNLFKLYYLLCWTAVVSEHPRGTAEEHAENVARLEELIREMIN